MVKHAAPVVAYYRVSTARQGQSGLGLEAQRAAVAAHVAQTASTLVAEFTEVETGTRKRHRPELAAALIAARAAGAVLIIAKLDRLARDVAFLSTLMNGDVAFRALDLPGASRFTLHILASVAEKEASDISERTKAALQAAKARGTKLGSPRNLTDLSRARSLAARRARAAEQARLTLPLVQAWNQLGWSTQRMADMLTELRVPQPRAPKAGQAPKAWQHSQVRRLVALAQREAAAAIPTPAPPAPAHRAAKRARPGEEGPTGAGRATARPAQEEPPGVAVLVLIRQVPDHAADGP